MTASKIVAAAASGVGGAGLDIDEVFRTYLYDGSSSSQTITNGLDLSGEGGMTWFKRRNGSSDHQIFDSERGGRYRIEPNTTQPNADEGAVVWTPTSTGFTINGDGGAQIYNSNNDTYCSWSFRKAPKFFDVVTYTGTGTFSKAVSHSLGVTPGLVMIKRTDATGWNWVVASRRAVGGEYETYMNSAIASVGTAGHSFSSTSIVVGGNWTADSQFPLNQGGSEYVVYLFAHNDGDGNFGPDADQDIIKVGEYTGNGSSDGPDINLGFEPQFLLIKNLDSTGNWEMLDIMRGMSHDTSSNDNRIRVNNTSGESYVNFAEPTPTGFKVTSTGNNMNTNSAKYLYMAIRRGPLAVPEDSSKVFDVNEYANNSNSNEYNTGFDVDMNINTRTGASTTYLMSRLTNGYFQTVNNTNETSGQVSIWNTKSNLINLNTGWWGTATTDVVSWSWRRAPSYFDQVTWDGNGSARTINHNLKTAPEMIWVKRRSATEDWTVYHTAGGVNKYYQINSTGTGGTSSTAGGGAANIWNGTAPTSSVFSIGTHDRVNTNGQTYHGFLFATAPGVSKVGYYTGSSGTVDVDCGFTNGAKFILIKLVSHSGYGWYVFDSQRGIVAGNDPHLRLNESTGAEFTTADAIDPLSSGFQVNTPANATTGLNYQGYVYIFYAVAA